MRMGNVCWISVSPTNSSLPVPGIGTSPNPSVLGTEMATMLSNPGHMIDYVMVSSKYVSRSLTHVYVYRGVYHQSDHEVVTSIARCLLAFF